MTKPTIVDTGVLVGLADNTDQWHKWTTVQAAKVPTPYITCEAVITEACHLLKKVPNGTRAIYNLLASGAVLISFDLAVQVEAVADKYGDVPMDFADACLVRMSELDAYATIFTVDGDFRVYRKHGKQLIPLIIPDQT